MYHSSKISPWICTVFHYFWNLEIENQLTFSSKQCSSTVVEWFFLWCQHQMKSSKKKTSKKVQPKDLPKLVATIHDKSVCDNALRSGTYNVYRSFSIRFKRKTEMFLHIFLNVECWVLSIEPHPFSAIAKTKNKNNNDFVLVSLSVWHERYAWWMVNGIPHVNSIVRSNW